MNKYAFKLMNIKEEDYKRWCKIYNKRAYSIESKKEFFTLAQNNKLIKDENGFIIKNKGNKK